MEEKLPNPEIINTGQIKKNPEKTIKVILGVLGLLGVLGVFYFLNIKKPVTPPTPQTTQKTSAIARVEEEELYQSDLDYYLAVYFAGQGEQAREKALEKAIDDSIILQEGLKSGFISLNQAVFDSPYKNMAFRSALIQRAEDKLRQNLVSEISGEAVSMWFNNPSYPKPTIGVEAAKQQTKQKMDKLYQELLAGKITFTEAGNRIKADREQANIDPSFRENSYRKFTNIDRSNKLFFDSKINDLAWLLGKGEISTVTIGQDSISAGYGGALQEAYFIIIKVTNKKQSLKSTFEEWLKDVKKQYDIQKN